METSGIEDKRKHLGYLLIITLSAVLFFIPNLGKVHLFDWDEINFAESAREMIVTHNYHRVMINFQPFWEKPPLFFWLQTLCMHMFGINEFSARLPNALFGVITLVTLYLIGRRERNAKFGFFWAISYLGTILPHLYFKSGIIDPVFNYFIFTGLYFMYRSLQEPIVRRSMFFIALAGIFIGLSNLTKGPVGLLIFLLSFAIWFIFKKFRNFPGIKRILIFLLCFSAVTFFWFGTEVIQNGPWFMKEFLAYQVDLFRTPVAGHQEPVYYHFLVVFLGCFPISVLALPILFRKGNNMYKNSSQLAQRPVEKEGDLNLLMKILFWTVMILFTIVTTKIVHYSSLSYLPLSFIACIYIDQILNGRKPSAAILSIVVVTGFIFSFLLSALPLVAQHPQWLISKLKDPVAVASLMLPVHWTGFEFLIGVVYFLGILFSVIIIRRKSVQMGFLLLFYATATMLFFYLVSVVPKIEAYSQGTVIDFYKSIAGKDVYVTPVAFKSYAHYYYFAKPGPTKFNEEDSLMTGNIDKPAYFVVKVTNDKFDSTCKDCKLIKEGGGYKFYRREAR